VSTIQGNFLSPGVQAMVKQFLRDDKRRSGQLRPASPPASAGEGIVAPVEIDGEAESSDEVVDRPSYIDAERAVAREPPTTEEAGAAEGEAKQEKLVDVR